MAITTLSHRTTVMESLRQQFRQSLKMDSFQTLLFLATAMKLDLLMTTDLLDRRRMDMAQWSSFFSMVAVV
ncbi:unnamed protein product [Gongylonema pulchrum]|uniref:NR LBD domain-containing protein n=1 Tax=Gongylonema pulchrum TaxID=637853 RepID=A0A183EHI7_9BILA|nr:unnamed protein product [Gongylonema pulchrum]